MKFNTDTPAKAILIGGGGTGANVLPHLYRIAYASGRKMRVISVDGDVVDEHNLIRQNFVAYDIGNNKVEVLAKRYADVFGIETEYVPHFVEDATELKRLVEPDMRRGSNQLVILIGAVDNNRSRQICHEVFNQANDLIYIDSGNGEYTGQVVCGVRKNGKTLWKPVTGWYPDILKVEDKLPTEMSCAERSVHAPQSIAANLFASTIITSMLYHILICGELKSRKATFSAKSLNVKAVGTKRG